MHRSIVHRLLDGELLCYSLPTRTDHRVQREGGRILGGAKHRGLKPSELRQTFTLTLKPRIVLLSRVSGLERRDHGIERAGWT